MRYARILEQIYSQPWLITPEAHGAIRSLIESRAGQSAFLDQPTEGNPQDGSHALRMGENVLKQDMPKREGEGVCGSHVEVPTMTFDEASGIAVIPIAGVIGMGLGKIEKGAGAVGVEDIERDIKWALSESKVRGIIYDIDSPGGSVGGTPELGTFIAEAAGQKPSAVFSRGQICSAAMWLAAGVSGSKGIHITSSAQVGSIGVYMPFVDASKRVEMMGYRIEIFKTGKYKGAGFPGTSLTDDQRENIQAQVDQIFSMFKAHVAAFRPVDDDSMQGQSFLSPEAKKRGLVDGIVRGIGDVKALF